MSKDYFNFFNIQYIKTLNYGVNLKKRLQLIRLISSVFFQIQISFQYSEPKDVIIVVKIRSKKIYLKENQQN